MTDSTGVFQHAVFSVPNFSEGYCTDDNARAFILAVLLDELGENRSARGPWPPHTRRSSITLSIATRRFHNHLSFDRHWLDDRVGGLSGRALWALGIGVGRSPYRSFQMMAGQLFARRCRR